MGARRVDESLRQRSSGSNNHKTPAGAAAAPQAKRTLPSNHASFTLTCSASARCPHRLHLPLSSFARPVPQFRFRRQPFASTAKKQQQHQRKKREFLSFIRRFPRNPHSPPISCTSLFIYVHIFLSCRRRKDFFL